MARKRLALVVLIINALLALGAIGWLVWITTSPRYWFADAYAAQGPQGERGQRGDAGPAGPAGPVGPDAEDAISSLESQLSDLSTRLDTLEGDFSDLQEEAGGSTLESDLDTVRQTVSDLCDALSYYDGALYDIYSSAC